MQRIQNPNIRILVVWEPILPTDWASPSSSVLSRISDRRAVQFWDKRHLLAEKLRQGLVADPAQPEPNCCERRGILWDVAALYPKQMRWGSSLPPAVFLDGPVLRVKAELQKNLFALLEIKSKAPADFRPDWAGEGASARHAVVSTPFWGCWQRGAF